MQDPEDDKDNTNLKLDTLMFNNMLNIQVWFKLNPYDEKIGPFRNIIFLMSWNSSVTNGLWLFTKFS